VRNALGAVQSLLVLGGASDIGAAVAERLVPGGCRSVVLAGRQPDRMEPVAKRLRDAGAEVAIIHWDASDIAGHGEAMKHAWAAVPSGGDVDCVVLAAGLLGEQHQLQDDPTAAAELMTVNYTGAAATLLHVARRMQDQGQGTIVVLSSVAGERVRGSNFVYGSSKAAIDGFAQGLRDALAATGVNVMIVRPGFVRSHMTEGRRPTGPARLATAPTAVADAVAGAMAAGHDVVWVPGVLRYLIAALRHLPGPLWRRVSAEPRPLRAVGGGRAGVSARS
jgi:decaprenylphospho-beta-D-erythro-pentofuranosid-2-ulose 2-reductase